MPLARRLHPEWLDELPADDPRALRARRDLERLNSLFGQTRLMARLIAANYGREIPRTLLELGAGDGTFNLHVAQRLARRWPRVHAILLDQQSIVSDETRAGYSAIGWSVETMTGDAFEYLARVPSPQVDIILANLFLHHIPQERLSWFLERTAAMTRLFAACEPRRTKFTLGVTRLSWMIGCGEVFLHDAIISVRAGFQGKELSALWPDHAAWRLQEHASGLFTHCFSAVRA
jgi:hypothetical protein